MKITRITEDIDDDLAKLRRKISALNKARLGSFGEFIFQSYFKNSLNADVQEKHSDDTDYIVNGEPVDVKTRGFNNPSLEYKGREDIIYAIVKLYHDEIAIHFKGVVRHIDWDQGAVYWEQWNNGRKISSVSQVKDDRNHWKEIKLEIDDCFSSKGITALKIIQRTKRFKGESPGNLMDEISISGDPGQYCRIYVEFKGYPVTKDNVDMIFAFPETDKDILPRLDNLRLKGGKQGPVDKIDPEKMPPKYIFNDLEDLYKNYFVRF